MAAQLTAHQRAYQDMRTFAFGGALTFEALFNILTCLMFGIDCLEGLDQRFTKAKVIAAISRIFKETTTVVPLPTAGND